MHISTHGTLNSKAEYRQNQIKRLSVQFTERELRAVEKELAKDDMETESALKSLSLKLKNKVVSNNLVFNCTAQVSPHSFTESLKRLGDQSIPSVPAKRARVGQASEMDRRSNGNTANESRNLSKRFKDWQVDNWWSQETLRTQHWPSSFVEASILAKQVYTKRDASLLAPITPIADSSPRKLSSCSSSISSVSGPDYKDVSNQSLLSPMSGEAG